MQTELLGVESHTEHSEDNQKQCNPLGVLKHGCFYVSENLSLKNDGSEDIYGTLQEAKRYAWTISRHNLLPMHVLDQSGNRITTFEKGIEMLVIQPTLEGIMNSSLSSDVAEEYGTAIWEYIAEGYKKINFVNSRLSKVDISKEELQLMKNRLDDKLEKLEYVLSDYSSVYLELMYHHIDSKRYRFREVKMPQELNFSGKHRRQLRKKGHVLTGKYAYQEGWTVGEF